MSTFVLWLTAVSAWVAVILTAVVLSRLSAGRGEAGKEVREELRVSREEARSAAKELREEITRALKSTGDILSNALEAVGKAQQAQIERMAKEMKDLTDSNQQALDRIGATLDRRSRELQLSNEAKLAEMRAEVSEGLKSANQKLSENLQSTSAAQQQHLEEMARRIKELQEGNERKLEEMRKTVDEELHDTLEKRLGESFKLVGDRLEAVHKDLGEMQNLATDLGDFKRVLTNVKARGTWAEVQLGAILEQILTPDEYEKNVQVRPDAPERVEYAIRLPGPRDDPAACVWLPIDSKFPQEDYIRLQYAADRADPEAVRSAADGLARTARESAKDIHDKYVYPPNTTDFAIMFLATEGLYAEVLRQPGLAEDLQQRFRVVVAGPTTLAAILNSLRLGFQTLTIERRAAEVWMVLAAIKTEFGKFGGVLEKVRRQLETASHTIEETGKRSRAMQRKLRSVEELPYEEASAILALPTENGEAEAEDSPSEN